MSQHTVNMSAELVDRVDHARRYFKQCFPKHARYAEDFAQWCAVKWLEGTYTNTEDRFKYMAIDFLRQDHRYKLREAYEIDVKIKQIGRCDEYASEINVAMKQLDGIDRAIFGLFHKWDFSNEEIGELFGMTPNAVGQRLFNLRNKIKKANKYN